VLEQVVELSHLLDRYPSVADLTQDPCHNGQMGIRRDLQIAFAKKRQNRRRSKFAQR